MADTAGMLITTVILIVVVIVGVLVIVAGYARIPLDRKYESAGGGMGGSFEAVWMPSAHEAGMERDRQTTRTAPAPSPGDPPSSVDGARIIIDI